MPTNSNPNPTILIFNMSTVSPHPLGHKQRFCPGALFTSTKETIARDQGPLGRLCQQHQALWPMASLTGIDHCVIGHFLNTLTPTVFQGFFHWWKRWTVENFALSVLSVFVYLFMTCCETGIYALSKRSENTPDEVSLRWNAGISLCHAVIPTKHRTFGWTAFNRVSKNTINASRHRALVSQQLMAALKEILVWNQAPAILTYFNNYHPAQNRHFHNPHETFHNPEKKNTTKNMVFERTLKTSVTSACKAPCNCFKSSKASSHLAASSHALMAALNPITSTNLPYLSDKLPRRSCSNSQTARFHSPPLSKASIIELKVMVFLNMATFEGTHDIFRKACLQSNNVRKFAVHNDCHIKYSVFVLLAGNNFLSILLWTTLTYSSPDSAQGAFQVDHKNIAKHVPKLQLFHMRWSSAAWEVICILCGDPPVIATNDRCKSS